MPCPADFLNWRKYEWKAVKTWCTAWPKFDVIISLISMSDPHWFYINFIPCVLNPRHLPWHDCEEPLSFQHQNMQCSSLIGIWWSAFKSVWIVHIWPAPYYKTNNSQHKTCHLTGYIRPIWSLGPDNTLLTSYKLGAPTTLKAPLTDSHCLRGCHKFVTVDRVWHHLYWRSHSFPFYNLLLPRTGTNALVQML